MLDPSLGNKSAAGLSEIFVSPSIVLIYFPETIIDKPLLHNGLTCLIVTVFGSREFDSPTSTNFGVIVSLVHQVLDSLIHLLLLIYLV